ncbi:MAG: ABC transporter ATP-binding protein/permease [Actinomycetota bacterium]|nr:ABC transporter ATP-binding protein/permease [Actinomycetota bacterium]
MTEPSCDASTRDLLGLALRTNRGLTWSVLALTALCGLIPSAFSIASGVTVGTLPAAVRSGMGSPDGSRLTWFLVLSVVLFVLQQALGPVRETVADALLVRVDTHMARRIMALTSTPPGIAHLEDPATVDRLHQAQGIISGSTPGSALYALTIIWFRRLSGVASLAVVVSFRWWLALVLVATQALAFRWRRQAWDAQTSVIFRRSSALRRSAYTRRIATDPVTAKETRVFGLDHWLVDRYRTEFDEGMAPVWAARRRGWPSTVGIGALMVVVHGAALMVVVRAGIDGDIGVGAVVVFVQAVLGTVALAFFGEEHGRATDGLASLGVLQELERELPPPVDAAPGRPVDGLPRRSIRFEAVGFRYPGRDADVFVDLNLELEVGRSTAIVGDNGSGKTTLAKLLAGLYEPTSGRITVDGTDLAEFDRPAWQRRVAAIFQDFVQYPFSAYDNVAVGALERCADRDAVEAAAARAGATATVEGLAHGWDTLLGREFTGGADLSGGEWQRLALARALFAVDGGAGVLVLDEPTASLDVRAEAELYDRFLDLTRDATTVVISHRFSTVRRADRIVVLEDGCVVEDGTHDSLVAAAGRYARMYALQASRFTAEEATGGA